MSRERKDEDARTTLEVELTDFSSDSVLDTKTREEATMALRLQGGRLGDCRCATTGAATKEKLLEGEDQGAMKELKCEVPTSGAGSRGGGMTGDPMSADDNTEGDEDLRAFLLE